MTKEAKQLSILHDLSKAIVSVSDMEEVCQKILNKTMSVLKVEKASIMRFDPEAGMLKIVAARGLPEKIVREAKVKVGEGISGKVFKNSKPILIKDIKTSGFESRKHYKGKSLMSAPVTCFPMKVSGRPVGVINVTDKKGGGSFSANDLHLLNTIANQTAAYLHLCSLAEEARSVEHIKHEIELARMIQQRLLPRHVPKLRGFEFAGKCLTAEKVGGDYFDFLVGGARPPSVVVADVAGHSVGAAMMMSAFRSAVRSDASISMFSPALIAERLNAILYDDLSAAEQFISMVYLQIMHSPKADGSVIKYTTAGHYPPLILRGGGFISHASDDMLLGVDRFAEFHEERIDVELGDVIVMYTDGLIEASNSKGKRFGLDKVKSIMKGNKGGSAEELINTLCGEVKSFVGNRPLSDDVTVVAIHVK